MSDGSRVSRPRLNNAPGTMTAPTRVFQMPPTILALFAPRPPLPYVPPVERKRKLPEYQGLGQYVQEFEDPAAVDWSQFKKAEAKAEKKARIAKERAAIDEVRIAEQLKDWNPHSDENVTGDAYKTLFIARVSYETSKSKLRREFEQFGPIKCIRLVEDTKTGLSRGYAFIEYERERDMRAAYKAADGKKIDGRRVLVDVERGRSVKNWKPRRLGGGLGATRVGGKEQNQLYPGSRSAAAGSSHDDHKDRDRERDRDRDRDRGNDRDRERDRDRDRDRERRR